MQLRAAVGIVTACIYERHSTAKFYTYTGCTDVRGTRIKRQFWLLRVSSAQRFCSPAARSLLGIDAAFGSAASKKFELDCNDDHELVEVRVSLPADISPDELLPALLQRAPNAKRSCTGRIQILSYDN